MDTSRALSSEARVCTHTRNLPACLTYVGYILTATSRYVSTIDDFFAMVIEVVALAHTVSRRVHEH